MKESNCALVLGGYVNGYCIIRELYGKGIRNIILFDYHKRLAGFSNKIKKLSIIKKNSKSLLNEIEKLHNTYNYVIVFPTDDLQIELLTEIYDAIKNYCFLPFNNKNINKFSDKYEQYKYCEKLGVPYPKTVLIDGREKVKEIEKIPFPQLLKPTTRLDQKINMFRSLELRTRHEYNKNICFLNEVIDRGVSLIASEIVPGDGSNIYAYVGYRNHKGEILNEWIGKKLSQFPNDFGVFSSASNQAPEIVRVQGRKLLNGMDLIGINEPEFKYDYRDGKYKLMEINLRSMMWHRTGNISGVNLQYAQYLDAIGQEVPKQKQKLNKKVHFVYAKHEIINLLSSTNYVNYFVHNFFKGHEIYFALFDMTDIKPFIVDCCDTLKMVIKKCLKPSETKSELY